MSVFRYGVRETDCAASPESHVTQIWLDNVVCRGNELELSECWHSTLGETNCEMDDLASCRCCDSSRECVSNTQNQCSGK